MRSTKDGVTWTAATAAAQNAWVSVAHGYGVWDAVASNNVTGTPCVMRSSDGGATWNNTEVTGVATTNWRSVAHGNSRFVAVASPPATNRLMYNPSPAPPP